MKDVRANYVWVGGFVLAMLVMLVGAVAMLTGRTGQFDTYTTQLDNVNGVKFGTKVTYEGFVVGQVEDITPLRDQGRTSFVLRLAVREGWPIPEGSVVRVTAPGILAAITVDIRGGQSQTIVTPGTRLAGGGAANIFAVMNDVAAEVSQLNQQGLMPLMATLNQRVDSLGAMLEKQAPELLANLTTLSADLALKTPRITQDVQKMTSTLSGKVVTDQNAQYIGDTLRNVTVLTGNLEDSRKKVDAVLVALDKTIDGNRANVDQSLKDLRYTLQTVARNIDSLTYNLEGTSRNFHEFSRQLRDDPSVLIGGNKPREDGPGRR